MGAPGCGKWSKPVIDNPKYKGKWHAPLINNPDYKVFFKKKVHKFLGNSC